MGLAEKMFSRWQTRCPLRSDCKRESDHRYFDSLFSRDWEVFVVQRNKANGNYDWFTRCCEAVCSENVKPKLNAATCG